MEHDNEHRRRSYGHRVGDIVDLGFNAPGKTGTVERRSHDNNRIFVRMDDGTTIPAVAEWCKTITKIEDQKPPTR